MATIYNQTDTAATFNVGCSGESAADIATDAVQATQGGTLGSTELVADWTYQSGGNVAAHAIELPAPGVSDWNGTWTVVLDITTCDAGDQLVGVYLCDFLSGTGYQTAGSNTSPGHTRGNTATGGSELSVNITVSSYTLQSTANSQPFIVLVWNNNDDHGAAGSNITPSQTITAPYTLAETATVTPAPLVAYAPAVTVATSVTTAVAAASMIALAPAPALQYDQTATIEPAATMLHAPDVTVSTSITVLTVTGDIITDGGFDVPGSWTWDAGWSVTGSKAEASSVADGNVIGQDAPAGIIQPGRAFLCTFTIDSISAGGVRVILSQGTGTTRTSPGTYSEVVVAGLGVARSNLQAQGTTTATIDNFKVEPVNLAAQPLLHAPDVTVSTPITVSVGTAASALRAPTATASAGGAGPQTATVSAAPGVLHAPDVTVATSITVESGNFIRNGTFDTDTEWSKGAGVTISGGVCSFAATTNAAEQSGLPPLVPGAELVITFDISNYGGGNLGVSGYGSVATGPTVNANGSYTLYLTTSNTNGVIAFGFGTAFTGDLDNVVVQAVPLTSGAVLHAPDVTVATSVSVVVGSASGAVHAPRPRVLISGSSSEDVPTEHLDDIVTVVSAAPSVLYAPDVTASSGNDRTVGAAPLVLCAPDVTVATSITVYSVTGDVITNGGFDTDTAWTKGAGWSISGGVASHVAGSSSVISNTGLTCVNGRSYRVTFTVLNYSAGAVSAYVNSAGTTRNANGTYTEILTATGAGVIGVGCDSAFVGDIDNVSVERVDLAAQPLLHAPDVTVATSVTTSVGTSASLLHAPDVTVATSVTASVGTSVSLLHAPEVTVGGAQAATVGTAPGVLYAPDVTASTSVTASVGVAASVLHAPDVSASTTQTATVESALAVMRSPDVTTLTSITVSVGTASAVLYAPDITLVFDQTASVGSAPAILHAPDVVASAGNDRLVGSASAILYAPDVTVQYDQTATVGSAPDVAAAPSASVKQDVSIGFDVPTEHVAAQTATVESAQGVLSAPDATTSLSATVRTVGAAPTILHAPAVATTTGAVTRTVGVAPAVLHAPDAVALAGNDRIVGSALMVLHAPDVTVAADQTVATDTAQVALHAPDVTVATTITTTVGTPSLVAHAPDVAVQADQRSIVDVSAAVLYAPDVIATAGNTRVVDTAGAVFHAPDVVLVFDQTVLVDAASATLHAPSVTVATGAVTRTVGTSQAVLHAPEVNTTQEQTAVLTPSPAVLSAPDVTTATGATTQSVSPATPILHAPEVTTSTGPVSRTVGSAATTLHAPAVNALNTFLQTKIVGIASAALHAPDLANVVAVTTKIPPLTVDCDSTVTFVECDSTSTDFEVFSTLTRVVFYEDTETDIPASGFSDGFDNGFGT